MACLVVVLKKKLKKVCLKRVLSLPPFITKKTINRVIDPFAAWYGAWPKFETESIAIGIHGDYPYLAVSDISAYFENIQLEILRDQLFDLLPEEQQITNLFISAFAFWTSDTPQGRQYMRGIPQGSDITRFFGNLFLAPIDQSLDAISEDLGIKYYRYMDYIRIFSKNEESAKTALLKFENEVRKQHLNLQTAKTKILREKQSKEITSILIDGRLNEFNQLADNFRKSAIKNSNLEQAYLNKLERLLERNPSVPKLGEQKIKGAQKPLTDLSDRLFRRIVSAYFNLNNSEIIPRLLSEISKNNDQRYARLIVRASQTFPRKKRIQKELLRILTHEKVATSREAVFLKACRYQSRIFPELVEYCKSSANDNQKGLQVRAQSLLLLARTQLNTPTIVLAEQIFRETENILIKRAASLVLVRQRGDSNKNFVESLIFHPNNELRKFGRYIHSCKTDISIAKNITSQAFKKKHSWLLVDYIPLLFLQSQSSNPEIRENLKNSILQSGAHKNHINMDMRDLLQPLLRWLYTDGSTPRSYPPLSGGVFRLASVLVWLRISPIQICIRIDNVSSWAVTPSRFPHPQGDTPPSPQPQFYPIRLKIVENPFIA